LKLWSSSANCVLGVTLALLYKGSIPTMLLTEYPEQAWEVWKLKSSFGSWWSELANKARRGDPLAETVVRQIPRSSISVRHQHMLECLDTLDGKVPLDSTWTEYQTLTIAQWKANPAKQMEYLRLLAKQIDPIEQSITSLYKVTQADLLKTGGMR